jgi:3-carboxy-cis,cis-muconate cycloisomerase
VVEEASRRASAEHRHLEEVLSQDERVTTHLKADELERLFDPLAYRLGAGVYRSQIAAMKR